MYYIYKLMPNRVLVNATDKQGCRLMFANKQIAYDRAAYESTMHPYPYVVDTNGKLNYTKDGKPVMPTCDNDCDVMGWDEYIITSNGHMDCLNMHVSVHPSMELDSSITVFSHDEQETVTINGWLWKWDRLNG